MAVLVETGCYADMTLPTEPGHSAQDLRVFRAPGTFPLIVQRAAVSVLGRPDWLFIKIHAHGMDPLHKDSVAGEPMRNFLEELVRGASDRKETLHFASAREWSTSFWRHATEEKATRSFIATTDSNAFATRLGPLELQRSPAERDSAWGELLGKTFPLLTQILSRWLFLQVTLT